MMNTDIYQTVTEKILAKLESGTVPWKHFAGAPLSSPKNMISKKAYHGINHLLLSSSEFSSEYWLTFNQCQGLGGTIKKGSKSEMVVFWKWLQVHDKETGEEKEIPYLRYFRCFNIEQTEGIEYTKVIFDGKENDPICEAEHIIMNMPNRPVIEIDSTPKAYYRPATDAVHVLAMDRCVSSQAYYETLLHELIHSTGHKSRLNRMEEDKCNHHFGSKTYANEELVAEIGAGFLCAKAGIFQNVEDNTAAYIANWLSALKNDKTLIVKAAGKAQKAADYILNAKD